MAALNVIGLLFADHLTAATTIVAINCSIIIVIILIVTKIKSYYVQLSKYTIFSLLYFTVERLLINIVK